MPSPKEHDVLNTEAESEGGRAPIRVASVPSGHVYVRHLSPAHGGGGVVRLDDPPPAGRVPDAVWWPPRMLEPAWIQEHAHTFDLMHIHFGFDALSPQELTSVVDVLRDQAKPLILTVHDLRNPHHQTADLHNAQLGVLVRAADAVITLTHGAAVEIRERWARHATVLPHPHVVPQEWLRRPRPRREGFIVGIHAKSLRASLDPLGAVDEVLRALDQMPDAVLRVDAHTDVMTPGFENHEPELASRLHDLASHGQIDLRVHDYFTDDELWQYLSSLDVSVLPYRFGTHSGWLEACYDLGTTVLAPDCGYYAEQHACVRYRTLGRHECASTSPSLTEALTETYIRRPSFRAAADERTRERNRVARAHERIYSAALSGSNAAVGNAPSAVGHADAARAQFRHAR